MASNKSSNVKLLAVVIILSVIIGVILALAVTLPSNNITRTVVAFVLCLISFIAGRLSNRKRGDNQAE